MASWSPQLPPQYAPESFRSLSLLVDGMAAQFGITLYQLGQLLGMSSPSNVYRYRSEIPGRQARRPSAMTLRRMVCLYALKLKGWDLSAIRAVNWFTGEVRYRDDKRDYQKGSVTFTHERPNRRTLPDGFSELPSRNRGAGRRGGPSGNAPVPQSISAAGVPWRRVERD